MARKVEVEAKKHNFQFVNSTEMRKAVATEATKHLDPEQRNIIAQQMSHSRYTAGTRRTCTITKIFIRQSRLSRRTSWSRRLEKHLEKHLTPLPLLPGRLTRLKLHRKGDPSLPEKQNWLKTALARESKKGQTILQQDAVKFLSEHPEINRNAKQIVDKVRNLSHCYQ